MFGPWVTKARKTNPNVILHYGITAGKTVFEPQPFENPLRGVPLLRRCRLVGLLDRVDDRYEQSEFRPLQSLGSHIAERRRIAAHLGNRVSAQSENPRATALCRRSVAYYCTAAYTPESFLHISRDREAHLIADAPHAFAAAGIPGVGEVAAGIGVIGGAVLSGCKQT
jgi:hypothetical protein